MSGTLASRRHFPVIELIEGRSCPSVVILNALDSGVYTAHGTHRYPENLNYVVGRANPSTSCFRECRNFFVFDMREVSNAVLRAELRLFNPLSGYSSPDAQENYAVFDVSTPVQTLRAAGESKKVVFKDLGTGALFGEASVSHKDNGKLVAVSANSAGVAYLNSKLGTALALGGKLTTLDTAQDQTVFGFTDSGYTRQLVLEVADSVPIAPVRGNTISLLPGSPAVDAGDNANAPEWDQRGPGFPRIVNGTIDIGAFEVQASPMPSDGVGRPTPSVGVAALVTELHQLDDDLLD